MSDKNWFQVDREGLREIVERRGSKALLVQELISNAWDEDGVTHVDVSLVPEAGSPFVNITVTDDAPNGFADLSHAWTLFAKSGKRSASHKRGRFNLGEKLVLAFCKEASITTTTGRVTFDHRGRTQTTKRKTEKGSEFYGLARMTRDQLVDVRKALATLLPPLHIVTTIDGVVIPTRQPLHIFRNHLWTEKEDADTGALARRWEYAEVRVYRPLEGETPTIYELGIPVVALDGDPLHVDVRQKIPLNLERENVTPSYLRDLRTAVLNACHGKLEAADLQGSWATDAISDSMADRESIRSVIESRFGADAAIADPSDREAENKLKARGTVIVHGGSLPAEAWERVKQHSVLRAAGQIAPTPRGIDDSAPPYKPTTIDALSYNARCAVQLFRATLRVCRGEDIKVPLADDPTWMTRATWMVGKRTCYLNVAGMDTSDAGMIGLAVHEAAHEKMGNHLDSAYHDELCRLAGVVAIAAQRGDLKRFVDDYERDYYRASNDRALADAGLPAREQLEIPVVTEDIPF